VNKRLETTEVWFDLAVFELDVIKAAAYRLTGEVSFDFGVSDAGVKVTLTFLHPQEPEEVESTTLRFKTEVLDQDLRRKIASETSAVRNAILAYAFSATGLQDADKV